MAMPLQSPRLQYFRDFFAAESSDQVASFVDQHRHDEDKTAFWLWSEDEPIIGLFINGDRAVLYHKKIGAWSSNQSNEDFSEMVEFLLENRQLDEFPAEVVIPVKDAVKEFAEHLASGQLPPDVQRK